MFQKNVQDQLTTISAKIDEIENGKIQNQLETMSAKLNEIYNRKEPVYAFRATSVKDSGSSSSIHISRSPGKMFMWALHHWAMV